MTPHIIRILNDRDATVLKGEGRLMDVCEDADSDILFGCRDGVCGTCLIEVVEGAANLSAPDDDEKDMVELVAPGPAERYRLACQCRLLGDVQLRYIGQ